MATVMDIPRSRQASVLIEEARREDDAAAEALWRMTRARAHPEGSPTVRLIARDAETHRFLGVADYFRTFPPENVLWAAAVVPEERDRGVGTALLRSLAGVALRNGRRNLCGFVADDDETTRRLLRSTGFPVRASQVKGGFYVELDLSARPGDPDRLDAITARTTAVWG